MNVIESYTINAEGVIVKVDIEKAKDVGLTYNINIPQISKFTSVLLSEVKNRLITEVTVGAQEILDPKIIENLKERFRKNAETIFKSIIPTISKETIDFLTGILLHEMLGLDNIEFLLNDDALEEIVIVSSADPVRVYHKKYGWLQTNITIPNELKIQNYSNIIARRVGRQITTLNPLLDAHLVTGDRANAVLYPISNKGNTITIRKFARDPWTVTDFIKNNTCSSEIFALIWLAIQYEMNILISGGTASGKTSMLNVCMPFIPPNHRILSIEDSVLGSSSILFKKNNEFIKSTVNDVIDTEIKKRGYTLFDGTEIAENDGSISVFSMNKKGKIELSRPSSFIRHKVKKKMYNIKLSSGRTISITKDHSLFTVSNNNILPIRGSDLKIGSFVATPRLIKYEGSSLIFDLTEHLDYFDNCMLSGKPIKRLLELSDKKKIKLIDRYIKNRSMPVKLFKEVGYVLSDDDKKMIKLIPKKSGRNGRIGIPLIIEFDKELACLAGMWLADGCYDKNSIIFSLANKECNNLVEEYGNRFGIKTRLHSDGISLTLNSIILKNFFSNVMGFKGNAYTKKLPNFVYNLSEDLISSLINGYFSGDGTVKKNEVCCSSSSLELLKGIQTLLLRFGVLLRIGKLKKDKTYESSISGVKFLNLFENNINFIHNRKREKLNRLINRKGKETKDVVPLAKDSYLKLKHLAGKEFKDMYSYKYWKSWQGKYLKGNNIGRGNLQSIVQIIKKNNDSYNILENNFIDLAFNDLIWDQIVSMEEFEYDGYVYDFSVPGNESFVCENIVAHNTRELQLPKFLYWAPLTVRQPNPEGKGEVTMLDLLVNSLRMRPDRIILGEMRKHEQAEVLFEAMHTGHSVYATVHANSINETIRRLTNPPISISKNLLEAVNLNVVMYRDRRKALRRVYQVGEFVVGEEEEIKPNILYRWKVSDDTFVQHSESINLFDDLSLHTGMTMQELTLDLKEKNKILRWMVKKKLRTVDQVGEIMNKYYIGEKVI